MAATIAREEELNQFELSQLINMSRMAQEAAERASADQNNTAPVQDEPIWPEYVQPTNTPLQDDSLVSNVDNTAVTSPTKTSPKVRIEDRIAELKRRRTTVARYPVANADTIIYLGRLGLENIQAESDLQLYFSGDPLLVNHNNLLALNSPYFSKFLGPFYQTKRWKSFGPLIQHYRLPSHIRYIINLTPDTEGMEAVEAIQDLSCPIGVLKWKQSHNRWSVSTTIVGGEDETDGTQEFEEYSRIRHVKSIERFMVALQEQDPCIDSASKLYTTVMISKAWNIQGVHPVLDWAVRWLCADPNTRFIEALPEATLKMADVMKCGSLCKDTFGILVGEAVLDSAVNMSRPGRIDSKSTMFQRIRGDVEEDWQNRIQHARNSFTDRIKRLFDDLVGEEMSWISHLPQMQLMATLASHLGRTNHYEKFLDIFKRFIRGSIYRLLTSDYDTLAESWESDDSGGDELYPRNTSLKAWSDLRAQERIFTRPFWKILSRSFFGTIYSTAQTNLSLIMSCFVITGLSDICLEYSNTSLLSTISIDQLEKVGALALSPGQKIVERQAQRSVQFVDEYIDSTRQSTVVTSDPSAFRQPHPGWKDQIGQTSDAQATYVSSNDIITPGRIPRCYYWTCATFLVSEAMRRKCSACGYSYCLVHTGPENHRCPADTWSALEQLRRFNERSSEPQSTLSTESNMGNDLNQVLPVEINSSDAPKAVEESKSWGPTPYDISSDSSSVLPKLLSNVTHYLREFCKPMLAGVEGGNLGGSMFEFHLVQTLTCLNEDETKFLPLWADGLDDGSGGVFSEHVPESGEAGNVLGPGGRRYPTRSEGSEYSFASGSLESTVNTSTRGHDGYRDTLPRGEVVAMSDSDSSSVGGWSYIQGAIDKKKGKQPALFTPDESEVATTLGALEDASVIDLGIKASSLNTSTQQPEPSIQQSSTPAILTPTIQSSVTQEESLEDYLMHDSDDEGFDSDDTEDADIELIDADELEDDEDSQPKTSNPSNTQPAASANTTTATQRDHTHATPDTNSRAASDNQESMRNVYYVYKGGKADGEENDDLMTRL